jgi:hypothetical protein
MDCFAPLAMTNGSGAARYPTILSRLAQKPAFSTFLSTLLTPAWLPSHLQTFTKADMAEGLLNRFRLIFQRFVADPILLVV